jgi:hypothetical protein
MARNPENEGLSLGYRIRWRLRRLLMTVFGPATLGPESDPLTRLDRERADRVEKARRARRDREARG